MPAARTPDARLEQNWGWGKRLAMEFQGGELRVTWRQGRDESRWKIWAAYLDENTSEFWRRRREWLIAAVICFGVAGVILLALAAESQQDPRAWHSLAFPSIIVLIGLGLLAVWLVRWNHKIILFDGRDGQHVVTVDGEVPSPKAVREFLDRVLAESRKHWRRIEEDSLASAAAVYTASEIRRFHELCDRGVLTREEFERKKRELLDAFTRR